MKLAMTLNYTGDPVETASYATMMEQAGIDLFAVAELYSFDAVSLLGFLAATTERAELMSGIMPIYTRTPTLVAMTAAGLDAVSRGRFVLGLGASGPQVVEGWHGVEYDAPIGRTREIIEICRSVWRRERLEAPGPHYPIPLPPDQGMGLGKALRMINSPVRDRIPTFIASLGSKNVEMTAEIADGWQPFLFDPEHADRVWGDSLRSGLARRDRSLRPLDILGGGPVAFCAPDERDRLLDAMRPHVALYLGGMGARGHNFYNDVFAGYGYESEARAIQDLYLDGKVAEAQAAVPLELLRRTSMIGDESYIRERIAMYDAAGVTYLLARPVGGNPESDIRRLRELVD